ncbi:isopenicillin N acyltransferase [Trichosporon asahii var. asahii CBS 8904]|uniref:Isopenicillin N acyltransferase n=1 Tax=Trichosporon asahii var. asahii (strain CBS 8904) TaxID=1220162 RepID=K1W970_TRIAC|nr:isopenicillin N acyltransferase [Trichosporon asahii var. asahii CBS 8904]
MLRIECSGTPYEHGTQAKSRVHGTLAFYQAFFRETAKLPWDAVETKAAEWLPLLRESYPEILEELEGLAAGSELSKETILALNVRTEVAFGLYTDGCTAFAIHGPRNGILSQNWDWKGAQKGNIVQMTIRREGRPDLSIVTEAGIIGKIGLSAGVGTTLNAIAALGVDSTRIPVHIALRKVLDWAGEEAVKHAGTADGHANGSVHGYANGTTNGHANGDAKGKTNGHANGGSKLLAPPGTAELLASRLEKLGVASAGHIIISDGSQAIGLETSYIDTARVRHIDVGEWDAIVHSNHYIEEHPGVRLGTNQMPDSPARLARISKLVTQSLGGLKDDENVLDTVWTWLKDTEGFPGSICRDGAAGSETIFSIIMDLRNNVAKVKEGKPINDGEEFTLRPN